MPVTNVRLGTISNPSRDNYITVQDANGDPRDATTGEPLLDGEAILCESGATGSVVGTDVNTVGIATFDGDAPASVEVDWSYVNSVDEYYNGNGISHDISIDAAPNAVVVTIVG